MTIVSVGPVAGMAWADAVVVVVACVAVAAGAELGAGLGWFVLEPLFEVLGAGCEGLELVLAALGVVTVIGFSTTVTLG